MVITPGGAFACVANELSVNVSVIETARNTVVATVPMPMGMIVFDGAITPSP